MKHYLAYLLLLVLPFTILSCGGSSGGGDQGSEQVAEPGDSKTAPDTEASRQIYTFNDESSLTPSVAFATDDEMMIVLGPDVEGDEMPLKSVIIQKDDAESLLVEFSANGMPSAFITRDGTVKINRYSYSEGKWFIHFSVNQEGSVTDHTVELPQSFGEYVSILDSWMRSRSEAVNQLSALSKRDQSDAVKDSIAIMLEVAAVGIEMGVCAASTVGGPGVMVWACQSAVSTTVDFIEDAQLSPPTEMDYQKCLFSVGAEGIHMGDPVCLLTTGLRLASDQLRSDTPDTSEMEELADKSLEQNRFIGEDPAIEDFPMPLLTAPQLAVISPQWLESFSTEQDVPIKVAASEGIDVVSFKIRSSDTGAVVVSGDSERAASGNFEIKIQGGTFDAGRYLLTISASNGAFSTNSYSSFVVNASQAGAYWKGDFQILEEQYISGNDVGAATRACQAVFSAIRYTEFSPLPHEIAIPIFGETTNQDPSFGEVMRVDADNPSGNGRYCTQNEISSNNGGFDYIARVMPVSASANPSDPIPLHETEFNFVFDSMSEDRVEGRFSATARVYRRDPYEGNRDWQHWHVGSCTGTFSLNKVNKQFNECNYLTEPDLPKICRSNEFDETSPYYCEWTENSD